MYKLIIAEKPSVAACIAEVVGATQKEKDKKGNGYFYCDDYRVTWCYGHLIDLFMPEDYDEKYSERNNLNNLPIIPSEYMYKVKSESRGQFNVIKELIADKECSMVIEGTDAAREGELIFRLVSSMAGNRKPTKRLWLNSMEDSAIVEALNNMKDISEYNNLYFSALARQRADWLFGMNFSRYYSARYNTNLSYGRVQTVIVKFLVDRDREIAEFVPSDYFHMVASLGDFSATCNVNTKAESDGIINKCFHKEIVVTDVKENEVKKNPPLLYDLTTLQREANKYLGYPADVTLDTLQSLYEKKLASYPRTDSCYITKSEEESTVSLLRYLISLGVYSTSKIIPEEITMSRVVNDAKVNDHSALLPTKQLTPEKFINLSDTEKNIMLMLCYRLLAVSSLPNLTKKRKVTLVSEGVTFEASGSDVTQCGYKEVEDTLKRNFGLTVKPVSYIPCVKVGDKYSISDVSSVLEHTKPPLHYTDDTLLSAMEHCGNSFEEEEMKEAIRDKGLGTPATRAAIISKVIKDGYAVRKKRYIISTDKASIFIPLVHEKLVKPELTGEWEMNLNRIASGACGYGGFMSQIETFIADMIRGCINDIDTNKDADVFKYLNTVGSCPKCGRRILEYKKVFICEANQKDSKVCDFVLYKNVGSPENPVYLTKRDVESLLKDGRTRLIKFISKNGKEYSCYLRFKPGFPPSLDREFPEKKGNK